ncbi:hypothetical protein YQE_01533, partial [Dendroctonus ponderosae]
MKFWKSKDIFFLLQETCPLQYANTITPDKFDDDDEINRKCLQLTKWIEEAKHVVVHTGAGISTAAGIPDFRGPNGVWTLEKEGKKPNINISFNDAVPTKTHMALKYLIEKEYIHYVISQNIDGLHLRTGLPRTHLAELHGNMFIGQCDTCDSQFVRTTATSTVGQKYLEEFCKREIRGRSCRGKLKDTILDWEADLPEKDLEMSDYHSSLADLNICLGTTLQIVPSGNLPLRCKKYGGKVVIVNLQPTKHDKKADLIINTYVDNVIEKVMKHLNFEIPEYNKNFDPTKNQLPISVIEWNIYKNQVKAFKKLFEAKHKLFRERKQSEMSNEKPNSAKRKRKVETMFENKHLKNDISLTTDEIKQEKFNRNLKVEIRRIDDDAKHKTEKKENYCKKTSEIPNFDSDDEFVE